MHLIWRMYFYQSQSGFVFLNQLSKASQIKCVCHSSELSVNCSIQKFRISFKRIVTHITVLEQIDPLSKYLDN